MRKVQYRRLRRRQRHNVTFARGSGSSLVADRSWTPASGFPKSRDLMMMLGFEGHYQPLLLVRVDLGPNNGKNGKGKPGGHLDAVRAGVYSLSIALSSTCHTRQKPQEGKSMISSRVGSKGECASRMSNSKW